MSDFLSSPTPLPSPGSYRGRFAPSPTGPLHAGSLVAALASWVDARAAEGRWLVRIEDIDPPREVAGAAGDILATLHAFGFRSDEPVWWQHARSDAYEAALAHLRSRGRVYACACSRARATEDSARRGLPAGVYAGTCRELGLADAPGLALRFRVDEAAVSFEDRACGAFAQNLGHDVGDFVVRRADGLYAYQLAVVVDDIAQGITHVVRGADLLDNTPRQIALLRALGGRVPSYLHVPVVRAADGEKLSKQNGAAALDVTRPLETLTRAAAHLGLDLPARTESPARFFERAIDAWRARVWRPPTMHAEQARRNDDG
jgi:glutamyl-Q tRNA(Asp) synthetase